MLADVMNSRESITHSVINAVIDRKLINTVEKSEWLCFLPSLFKIKFQDPNDNFCHTPDSKSLTPNVGAEQLLLLFEISKFRAKHKQS